MEWIDGNIGSRLTMKYPAVYMVGPEGVAARCCRWPTPGPASTRTPGAKMVHAAPETTSQDRVASRSPRTAAAPATAASSGSRTTPTAARATCSATR